MTYNLKEQNNEKLKNVIIKLIDGINEFNELSKNKCKNDKKIDKYYSINLTNMENDLNSIKLDLKDLL